MKLLNKTPLSLNPFENGKDSFTIKGLMLKKSTLKIALFLMCSAKILFNINLRQTPLHPKCL